MTAKCLCRERGCFVPHDECTCGCQKTSLGDTTDCTPDLLRLLKNGDNEHDAEIDACVDAWQSADTRLKTYEKALRFALDNLREIAIPMAEAAGRVTSLNHAQRMIEKALGEDTRICAWTYDHRDDLWNTACGECFVFEDGGPKDNSHKFCGYCGKPLKEVYATEKPE